MITVPQVKMINFVLLLCFVSAICQAQQAPYIIPLQLNDGIKTGTLKDAKINESIVSAINDSILIGSYKNIHSVLVLRNNKLVYESYFTGDDQTRGVGLIKNASHHRDSLHDVRSISKSIVSAAVIVCLDNGLISSLDQSVYEYFPEYLKYKTGLKSKMTVRHLLTMSCGLDWNEGTGYNDPNNSEVLLNNSEDPVDFFFSRKAVHEPGKVFNYNGGCTQILASIVSRASGISIAEFTAQNIFKPLDIEIYSWFKRQDGIALAASGIRLRSRDMAKFGLLYLNSGIWNGKQVISSQLVNETLRPQIQTQITAEPVMPQMDYSYQFWLPTFSIMKDSITVVMAMGNGGQIILIDKALKLVMVVTAGNYNNWNMKKYSEDLYWDIIYPAVKK